MNDRPDLKTLIPRELYVAFVRTTNSPELFDQFLMEIVSIAYKQGFEYGLNFAQGKELFVDSVRTGFQKLP